MAKYNLIITQEPGALFMRVIRGADGVDLWRGRCDSSEKMKTVAEAFAEVVEGKPLRDMFIEKHGLDKLDPKDDPREADHKRLERFDKAWQSPALFELVGEITAKHGKDFRIVDLTEEG